MRETPRPEGTAAELRRAFDLSFALPPSRAVDEAEDLLAIRVAGDPYAVRVRDLAGVVTGRTVVGVPAATPDLLGLAGIRGGVVPVFGLASLLGHGQPPGSPRWMILCGAGEPLALAFSDFDGYLRLPRASLHAGEGLRAAHRYVDQVASTPAGARPVISLPLVVAAIRDRSGRHGRQRSSEQ